MSFVYVYSGHWAKKSGWTIVSLLPSNLHVWVNASSAFYINCVVGCWLFTSKGVDGGHVLLLIIWISSFFCSDLVSHSVIQSYFLQVMQTYERSWVKAMSPSIRMLTAMHLTAALHTVQTLSLCPWYFFSWNLSEVLESNSSTRPVLHV